MRSRQRGWIMPEEDIPSMLQMIEAKIASSEIAVDHRHALIRLRDILEGDLQSSNNQSHALEVDQQPNISSTKVQSGRSSSSLDN